MKKKRSSVQAEFTDFMTGVMAYDQRSSVIVIVAKLDMLLYQIIKKITFPSPRKVDELLDGDAPLSSFSAKIIFVHRLGRMDDDLSQALHLIRRIRNDFAHNPDSCGLGLSPHADRIREIAAIYRGYPQEYAEYRDRVSKIFKITSSIAEQDFFTVCAIVLQTIMLSVRQSEKWRSKDVPHMELVPYGWKLERSSKEWKARLGAGNTAKA